MLRPIFPTLGTRVAEIHSAVTGAQEGGQKMSKQTELFYGQNNLGFGKGAPVPEPQEKKTE